MCHPQDIIIKSKDLRYLFILFREESGHLIILKVHNSIGKYANTCEPDRYELSEIDKLKPLMDQYNWEKLQRKIFRAI